MSGTGLVWSEQFLEHETGRFHPERPERLRAIHQRLHESGLINRLEPIEIRPVEMALVETVHAPAYIERFRQACAAGQSILDTSDCPISRASYDIARLAAGGVVAAVDAMMTGQVRNAFCAVRPPGHHAEHARAMGFCFFNNVAIAAEHLRTKYGVGRVAILDWDVHHGNGTQHHFEHVREIFFCSIHQHPDTLYPGTGFSDETGYSAGVGATLNVPMMPSQGDEDYRRAFETRILPAIDAFRPEVLLISAGFDAHHDDPLAHIELSTEMFGWMTARVMELAERHCGGRLVSVLEGGYNLKALAASVQLHIETLLGGGA